MSLPAEGVESIATSSTSEAQPCTPKFAESTPTRTDQDATLVKWTPMSPIQKLVAQEKGLSPNIRQALWKDTLDSRTPFLSQAEASKKLADVEKVINQSQIEDDMFGVNHHEDSPAESGSEDADPNYMPTSPQVLWSDALYKENPEMVIEEAKYICFKEPINFLLKELYGEHCEVCSRALEYRFVTKGSALLVFWTCSKDSRHVNGRWCSQPRIHGMYAANLLIPACIPLTGSLFVKLDRFLQMLNCSFVGKSSHHRVQRIYVHEAHFGKKWLNGN
ncbi:PREDICTED: uncharacterized protein LOC106809998 [Priapulus caudatus]|uniref:Uncharacterized protein LOC106809998 n=1 Tax=Priapulus caudatus TaxID=37621 RepID=A0ABM1E967_PRICU|nr:PREDICTED: uncharacterized protein LOC106809998 [Priapulus caudatus]